MPIRRGQIGRDVGAAIAVLAAYLLVLLAPLHQMAGLQRDLARLGYETLTSWTICITPVLDEDGNPDTPTAAKCPVAGVAKLNFVPLDPPAPLHVPVRAALPVSYGELPTVHALRRATRPGQPRAPPVLV